MPLEERLKDIRDFHFFISEDIVYIRYDDGKPVFRQTNIREGYKILKQYLTVLGYVKDDNSRHR